MNAVTKAHALAREHPDASARTRLAMVREAPLPIPLVEDWTDGIGGSMLTFTTEGFNVTIRFEPDDYPEPRARFTDSWEPGAVQHPAWRPNDWDRTGRWLGVIDRVYRWILLDSGSIEEHYVGLHKLGHSKAVARELAEEYVRQDIQRAINPPEEWVCIVTASKAGIELGRDVLGGIDGDDDYLRRVPFDHGMIDEAVASARASLDALCAARHETEVGL